MCTTDEHNNLKTDPTRLAAETQQGRPQNDENGVVEFYVRECESCGSSLAVPIEVERSARVLVK